MTLDQRDALDAVEERLHETAAIASLMADSPDVKGEIATALNGLSHTLEDIAERLYRVTNVAVAS